MDWDVVIGLEVHVQLKTQSKLFSGTATQFGAKPNTQTSFVDAGFPGTLPVLNREAVQMALLFGLSIDAELNNHSFFERKHYFYPDLPKGYQISQFQRPIVSNGRLEIRLEDDTHKSVLISRAHLEEDAGKLLHDVRPHSTGIDLNRAGNPLLEIVTTPCLSSAQEALCFLKTLHQWVQFLGICDGSMQEGSFRCDVNLSLKPHGSRTLGVRTELKNLNSFRYIEKAIQYEIARHQECLELGQPLVQETRLFHPHLNKTFSLRHKETQEDYRYCPDPDLPVIDLKEFDIDAIQKTMPELPNTKMQKQLKMLHLSEDDIQFLLSSPDIYHYYQAIKAQSEANDKLIVNWLKGSWMAAHHQHQCPLAKSPVTPELFGELLNRIVGTQITSHQAKVLFADLWRAQSNRSQPKETLDKLIEQHGFNRKTMDNDLSILIDEVLQQYPQQVADYKTGKDKLFGFFVGQIMKCAQGNADPENVNTLLIQKLKG